MEALFEKITVGMACSEQPIKIMGRSMPVKKAARTVVWFDFKELCCGAHGQEEYLEIALHYPTVFLSNIPRMSAGQAAEARRFTWLVDVLYDNNVRLVASSAAAPHELYTEGLTSGEFIRTASRLADMQTMHYLEQPHHSQKVTL